MKQIYGRLLLLGFFAIVGVIVGNAIYFQPKTTPNSEPVEAVAPSLTSTGAQLDHQEAPKSIPLNQQLVPSQRPTAYSSTILEIQKLLAKKHYYSEAPNGVDTLRLRTVILRYESENGIELSGLPDGVFLNILSGGTPGIELMMRADMAKKSFQTIVKAIQSDLLTVGFDSKRLDGVWDKGTKQAIEAFEYNFELKVTGQISPYLLDVLARELKDPDRYLKPLEE